MRFGHFSRRASWCASVAESTRRGRLGALPRAATNIDSSFEPEFVTVNGCSITTLARTLIDMAASSSFLIGVTMMDHVLRVEQERAERERWQGATALPARTKNNLYAELAKVHPRTGGVQAHRHPSDVVVVEKNRENLLRPFVHSFDRWDWDTAYSPSRFNEFLTEHGVPPAQALTACSASRAGPEGHCATRREMRTHPKE